MLVRQAYYSQWLILFTIFRFVGELLSFIYLFLKIDK